MIFRDEKSYLFVGYFSSQYFINSVICINTVVIMKRKR
ncbi:hypothetical protein RU95_GL000933 [Enterococcus avium]|nr:hypothetical protein RU95_GL000933 [Enterococcus avium]